MVWKHSWVVEQWELKLGYYYGEDDAGWSRGFTSIREQMSKSPLYI